VFLDHFDALMSKIIFKKLKKYYFNTFSSEKHFEKQPQPHSQTRKRKVKVEQNKFQEKVIWYDSNGKVDLEKRVDNLVG